MEKLFSTLRTLAVLIVLTFTSIQLSSAQSETKPIRTDFFGFTLAQSTKTQVKQALTAKGMKFKVYSDKYSPYSITANRVKLGAHVWDEMALYFSGNTLARVEFRMYNNRQHSEAYLAQAYKTISEAYEQLYGEHHTPQPELNYPTKAITPFYDETTYACVKRIEAQTNVPEMLVIDFMNYSLMKQANSSLTSLEDLHELAGFE